jgi:uncharacterized membrane protein YkvA (DUF1232 family)
MLRLFKEMITIALGVLAFIYLINPTAGFIELIPDNLPLIGNIDEGFATMVLLSVLRYYGLDLSRFFGSGRKPTPIQSAGQK